METPLTVSGLWSVSGDKGGGLSGMSRGDDLEGETQGGDKGAEEPSLISDVSDRKRTF